MRTLDTDECAEFLKVERSTVFKLAGEGKLPGAKIGRSWVFLEDDLVEYLRAQVRSQQRLRAAEQEVQEGFDRSAARTAPLNMSPMRRKPKRQMPTLESLDALAAAHGIDLNALVEKKTR